MAEPAHAAAPLLDAHEEDEEERELLAPLAPLALMGADDGGGEGQTDEGRADEERRGMAYYAASTVWASLMGVCVKAATRNGTGVLFVIAARCAVGIGLALAVLRHENLSPLGNNRRLLVTRGAVGCGGIIGLLIGMDRLPLVACSLLSFFQPIVAAVVAWPVLGEAVHWSIAAALPVAITGATCIALQPGLPGGGLDALGVVAAGISPVCIGSAGTIVRKLQLPSSGAPEGSPRPEHPQVVMIYLSFTTLAVTSIMCVASPPALPSTFGDVALVLLAGVCGWLNQLCMTLGLKRAPAARATAMSYLGVLWNALADAAVFGLRISPASCAGGALILGSTAFVARRPAWPCGGS